MKPYLHGLISVKKFGGKPEDYQKIHDWFDQGKAHVADMRHRAILHNSLGIYICEQVFGTNITNSDGKLVSVRDIGEQHVLDDLGTIPSVQDYLTHLPWLDWLGGPKRAKGTKADEAQLTQQPSVLRDPPPDMFIDGSKGELDKLAEQKQGIGRLQDLLKDYRPTTFYTVTD